jgi:hypothetical protein
MGSIAHPVIICVDLRQSVALNQGESSWLMVNQGESRPFETFFYALRWKWPAELRSKTQKSGA